MRFDVTAVARPASRQPPWRVHEGDDHLVLVVCSAWGAWHGLEAEHQAARTIADAIVASTESLNAAVVPAMRAMHEQFVREPDAGGITPACSCCVIVVAGTDAHAWWIGACAPVVIRAGAMFARGVAHTVVAELVAGGMAEETARQGKVANIITRSLGVGEFVAPAAATWSVQPADRLVVGSELAITALVQRPHLPLAGIEDAIAILADKANVDAPDILAVQLTAE